MHGIEDPLECYKCVPSLHTYRSIFFKEDIEGKRIIGDEEYTAKDSYMAFNRALQMAKAKRHFAPHCTTYAVYKLIKEVVVE